MANKTAAGLVMYRIKDGELQVFLVHPGGPMWTNRDIGAWSIPKGEPNPEDTGLIVTAVREFVEETHFDASINNLIRLGEIKQKSGKVVHAWAFEDKYNTDPTTLVCNKIEIEHPPKSGKMITIPEVDRGEFFSIAVAETKINPAQVPFLHRLTKDLTP